MATNLQFIKSASGTSVSSLSVTDCFSDKYDVYLITSDTFNPPANNNGKFRLIDSGGSVISASEYSYANLNCRTYNTFSDNRSTSDNFMGYIFYSDANQTHSAGLALYIYNPYDSSSYTFSQHQDSNFNAGSGGLGRKAIGVHKSAEQITGINFFPESSASADFSINVFGVK